MQRGPEQGISREVWGGGVSVSNTTVSQGRPSPLVEAAIRPDGGQMRPVTSAALAVTHFYFGVGWWWWGRCFLDGDWVSGQCHNAVAVNS